MSECIHMVIEGTIAEHMAKLELAIYRKYIWHDNKGKPMLCEAKKALCGMLQVALFSGNCCPIHL